MTGQEVFGLILFIGLVYGVYYYFQKEREKKEAIKKVKKRMGKELPKGKDNVR